MTQLTLSLFGPVCILVEGEDRSTSVWTKTLALLAYLAVEADRPHRREALAGLLWPEQPEAAARNSLRQALHQLRRALGEGDPPFLSITPQAVQFHLGSTVALDVAEFGGLLAATAGHAHRHLETCPDCVERLERAVALYRGDLLAELFLRDSVGFEEWVLVQRERYRQRALDALQALARHASRRGDAVRLERTARRQLELDPFREEAHREVMRALAWRGQPNAALAHCAALEEMLRQELGVGPEDETTALAERIRRGDIAPPALPPLHNWAVPPIPLVGREAEVAALAGLLQSPKARLISVVGTGGIGKTRLAQEVAAQEAWAFADGACFVPLAAVPSPEFVVPAIAAALGQSLVGGAAPQTRLRDYLADKELLLVLDNLEHLLPAAQVVGELLAACPRLRVLVTSREPLRLRAEQQFRLAPLALPEPELLPGDGAALAAKLAAVPAVNLFVQRVRAVEPTFALDEGNAAIVGEICTRLEGLPLALELAAAQVDALTLPEILARLERRLAFLVDGSRDLPPRQRTLRATLDWSYDLLTPGEKELLAGLSVFAGGCTPAAVQEVCVAAPDASPGLGAALRALSSKSLLQRQEVAHVGPWVTMLEVVHEYACERLAERAEQAVYRDRHARYYMALAERFGPLAGRPEGEESLARLEQERNNLRAALQWALQRGDREVAVRLGAALWVFWDIKGDYTEGRNWLEAVLQIPAPVEEPTSPAEGADLRLPWIRLLAGAGVFAGEMGDMSSSVVRLEQALALCRGADNINLITFVLAWLGWAAGDLGDCERAIACYEECLALDRQREETAGRVTDAFCLNGLGTVAQYRGDYATARDYLERSLAIRRELGDSNGTICTLCNLGTVALSMGDSERARGLLHETLGLAWKTHDEVHIAWSLLGLAQVLLASGRPARAAELLVQVEHQFRFLGSAFDAASHRRYEQAVATARVELGEEAFSAARDTGAALTLAQAVAEALGEYDTGTR
jgi:predicted ATPase/DNA-binding SARP family transcriptional activator